MSKIITVLGKTPQLGSGCKVFETAVLIGDIVAGENCTFWFQSVVRGDVNSVRLGDRVNVQDGAILHCTYKKAALTIGNRVSIGHRAIVHGCTIHDDVLIGMGAIIMDHAVVESGCLIAAGAVVTQGMHCKSGYIYAGLPAKPIKQLSKEMMEGEVNRIADAYVKYASWYEE
jgi:carbonic anhydrase/acetyltransferase-like protein (isoleucine patch superfamily)